MIVGPGHSQDLEVWGTVRLHPTADIHPTVDLGDGTVVWAWALILGGVCTGVHCSIGAATQVMRDVRMGDSCRIGAQVHLTNRMRIGSRVFIAPMTVFADDRYPRVNNPRYRGEPPTVEDDVNVGVGVVVLPGVTLGRGCTIGAGAVVTKDVPPSATMIGNPARLRIRPIVYDPVDGELVSLEGL